MNRAPPTVLAAIYLAAAACATPPEPPAAPADAAAEPAAAGAADAAPRRRVMTSRSQRFMAIGARPGELIELLVWAEDTADRLARLIGRPLPAERGAPLQFILDDDPETLEGRVRVGRAEELGGFVQRVIVTNPDAADPAEALDAFCFLLLSRYVQTYQPPTERRTRPGHVPAWWAAGVARQLLPGARQLAQREVLNAWEAGHCLSLRRILAPRTLQPDFVSEKPYAALAVGWLRSRRDFVELADELARRWTAGNYADADWFAERMADGDPRGLEIEWELWIAAARQRQGVFAPATAADLRALRERLTLPRADLPADLALDLPSTISPDDLARHAGEAWTAAAARRISGAIARLRFGRGSEFREVIAAYDVFLAECARAAAGPTTGWAAWQARRRLRARLAEARKMHARLEARVAAAPGLEAMTTAEEELEQKALEAIERDAAGGPEAVILSPETEKQIITPQDNPFF